MLASVLAVHTNPIRVLLNGKLKPEPTLQSPGIISRLNVLQQDRIFLLIDPQDGQEIMKVSAFFATDDGEEIENDISVHVLDKNDTTIHKLAARALLDDLELGRSDIHMESKDSDQAQRFQERCEEIAHWWKLLSKWTRFIMSVQKDSDGSRIPATLGSVLMQTRLLTRTPKVHSRLVKGRFEDEKLSTSSSEEWLASSAEGSIRAGKSRRHWTKQKEIIRDLPPNHNSNDREAPSGSTEALEEDLLNSEHITKIVQEEFDKRDREQRIRTQEEEQTKREN